MHPLSIAFVMTFLTTSLWLFGATGGVRLAAAETMTPSARRFAVIVGANRGAADEARLKYAETDAEKVHEVLRHLGGFRPEDMILLKGEDADTVRRALLTVNARIRNQSSGPPEKTALFVYFSGHGDARNLHFGGTELPLEEIKALIDGSPAGFRMLTVDACRSGALTRAKGGTIGPPFLVTIKAPATSTGAVF